MEFSRLFRRRWAALLCSTGIVWAAYDMAGDAPEPVVANAVSGNLVERVVERPTDASGTAFGT